MTSTYDALGSLCNVVRTNPEYIPLLSRLFEYTVDEISKVEPKTLNWDDFITKGFYSKLDLLSQLEYFFSAGHDLDHITKYHLKTISPKLNLLIITFRDWFVTYKDRSNNDRWYNFDKFNAAIVKRYPKVFKELKKLIDDGTIQFGSWYAKTYNKKVARWEKYF